MSIIATYKTAAAVILGESFAHYGVLPNGALMFGGLRAYEEGKFLEVSKQGVCFTNPFGKEPDVDVTADFKAVVNRLQEADAAEGEQAVKLFIETNVAIGAAGFVGADDMLVEEHIIATILWQKLLANHTWKEVKEMAEDAKRTGEDSFVPHALTELDILQAVAIDAAKTCNRQFVDALQAATIDASKKLGDILAGADFDEFGPVLTPEKEAEFRDLVDARA